jgi:hypothetical protein
MKISLRAWPLLALCGLVLMLAAPPSWAQDPSPDTYPGPSHYLRGAYQAGRILTTNDFLKGDNKSGQPIDGFQSLRLEFGWQTDGSRDWHHVFNFPSYGIGIYGADFFNDEEMGTPNSLYGFFTWPLLRSNRWTFNFEFDMGYSHNWESYDPVGLGRSVHVGGGFSAEYRLAEQWSLIGAVAFTHISNGGTQRPNFGVNQIGPLVYVKYDTGTPVARPTRRNIDDYANGWDLTFTGSGGKRNLTLQLEDPALREEYVNRNYFVGNLTVGLGKRFAYKSRFVFGLDLGYDESVGNLIVLDGINRGVNAQGDTGDNYELAIFGGYELVVNGTHAVLHLGYKVLYKDVPGRLPAFYQRLGIKQFMYKNLFIGMNVRFHELGSADNLEWNIGYAMDM